LFASAAMADTWTNTPTPSTNTPGPAPSVYISHLSNTNDPHKTLRLVTNQVNTLTGTYYTISYGNMASNVAAGATNFALALQTTQAVVRGWAVAASNLAVALQGSQSVIRADVSTVSNLADAAQTAGEVAAAILNATNALGTTAFTPTSRWVAATGGVARGLLLFDDPGLRWSGTNGYAILATNTAPDGYSFVAMQNNSEDVLSFGVRGTAAAGTLFGQTNAGAAQVYSFASPLHIGSYNSDPVILGVDNAERFRMTSAAGNTNLADLHVTGTLTGGGLGGLAYSNSITSGDIAGGLAYIGSSNGIGTNTTISGWLTAGAITGASAKVTGTADAGSVYASGAITGSQFVATSYGQPGCTDLGVGTNLVITGATYSYIAAPTNAYVITVSNTAPRATYDIEILGASSYTLDTGLLLRGAWTPTATNLVVIAPNTGTVWRVYGAGK
jgi:hypothetical protein